MEKTAVLHLETNKLIAEIVFPVLAKVVAKLCGEIEYHQVLDPRQAHRLIDELKPKVIVFGNAYDHGGLYEDHYDPIISHLKKVDKEAATFMILEDCEPKPYLVCSVGKSKRE